MSGGYNPLLGDVILSDYQSALKTVGLTQVLAAVGGSNLSGRQELLIFNDGNFTLYYGPNGVTISGSTKGIPIQPGGLVNLPFGPNVAVYLISDSAAGAAIIQELG